MKIPAIFTFLFLFINQSQAAASPLPKGFVYLREIDPTIIQEIRYYSNHNFVGRPLPGYSASECILTKAAAEALRKAQNELRKISMSLKVYDCYRPQRTVNYFIVWAKDLEDVKMKKEFYPQVDKADLFKDGYIAAKSGHSRGSTIDLAIVSLPVKKQSEYHNGEKLISCTASKSERFQDNSLDFGTSFDCFDPLAHTINSQITDLQKQHRLMLKSLMKKYGFRNLPVEWWHYTFENEPFPNHYFDFEVR